MEDRYETILRIIKEEYEFYFYFRKYRIIVEDIKEYHSLKQIIDNEYIIL